MNKKILIIILCAIAIVFIYANFSKDNSETMIENEDVKLLTERYKTEFIAVFMIYHNINISITYNKKNIGVLRSIGVSKMCTMKIFGMEAIIICTISSILSTIAGVVVMNIVNKTARANIKINPYDILVWNYSVSIVVIVITFVLFISTAIIPIMNYGKKTPIEVIRGN